MTLAPARQRLDFRSLLDKTQEPGPSSSTLGTAKIEQVWDDLDDHKYNNGFMINVNFYTLNLQAEHLQVAVFFYFQDRRGGQPDFTRGGRPVMAILSAPNKFKYTNGTFGVWDIIDTSLKVQPTKHLFVPYSALDMPVGMSYMKYHVQIRASDNASKIFDTSNVRAFHVSRGEPAVGKHQGCCCAPSESFQACFLKCNAIVPNCQ